MKDKLLYIINSVGNDTREIIKKIKEDFNLYSFLLLEIGEISGKSLYDYIYPEKIKVCTSEKNGVCKYQCFSVGYRFCGPSNKCECAKKSVSEKTKNNKLMYNEEKKTEIREKRRNTNKEKYGVINVFQLDYIKNKSRETSMEKYGVSSPRKAEIVKQKTKETCLQKYGVDNPLKSTSVQQKTKETCLDRYGVENPLMLSSIRNKAKETCVERYGVENPNSDVNIRNKAKETCIDKYGVENPAYKHMSVGLLEKLENSHEIHKLNETNSIFGISKLYNVSPSAIEKSLTKGGYEIVRHTNSSHYEDFIYNIVINNGVNAIKNDRTILSPREIDVYIPEEKLAIEVNGSYYHCEKGGKKTSNYHLQKTLDCEEKNIRLIHFSSVEIDTKPKIVESITATSLGKYKNKYYARKCTVGRLDYKDMELTSFLNNTHLQGYTGCKIAYVLKVEDKIVSAMTFGKPRYNNKYDWELIRYAVDLNTTIVGGAERLFSSFIKDIKP